MASASCTTTYWITARLAARTAFARLTTLAGIRAHASFVLDAPEQASTTGGQFIMVA